MADQEGVTPPGMEHVVKKLKEKPGVENPWAIAWKIYHEQKGKIDDLDNAALDAACRAYKEAQAAGTLLAEIGLAAAGVPAAQAVLLGHAMGQTLTLYRETP
jgi:hypothetical protein